jgi:protein dithiol oxidoreductase (disulfide-forming)
MRSLRQIFAMLALILCATSVRAEVVAGRDYHLLNPPQPITTGNKIEVLEFFFYGCPHCYHLHPLISEWEKKKPKDVDFQYVPTIFNEGWEPMAHTYYALQAMGKSQQLHDALFQAWNENVDLSDEAKISAFVAKHGVDAARFDADYNSFTVETKIMQSNQMVQSYGVRGTPTIAVDGKYIISGLQPAETIRVLNEVIKIARKDHNNP